VPILGAALARSRRNFEAPLGLDPYLKEVSEEKGGGKESAEIAPWKKGEAHDPLSLSRTKLIPSPPTPSLFRQKGRGMPKQEKGEGYRILPPSWLTSSDHLRPLQ